MSNSIASYVVFTVLVNTSSKYSMNILTSDANVIIFFKHLACIKLFNKMKKGEIFKIDRWRDGELKEYKCMRLCRKFISVKSLDGTENWGMPYERLKDVNPTPKEPFVDNIYNNVKLPDCSNRQKKNELSRIKKFL